MYRKDSRYWSADDVQTNANIAPAIRNDETMMSVIATSFIDSSKLSEFLPNEERHSWFSSSPFAVSHLCLLLGVCRVREHDGY